MALTAKQQKFVDEYFISGNATDAARLADIVKRLVILLEMKT